MPALCTTGLTFRGVETDGTALTKDAHKLATKRQSWRWVLIDEVSMIFAPLVGVLDTLIGKVIWKRDS